LKKNQTTIFIKRLYRHLNFFSCSLQLHCNLYTGVVQRQGKLRSFINFFFIKRQAIHFQLNKCCKVAPFGYQNPIVFHFLMFINCLKRYFKSLFNYVLIHQIALIDLDLERRYIMLFLINQKLMNRKII